jgi:hypothetical protein
MEKDKSIFKISRRDKKAYIHDKYSGINKFRDRINEAEAWWIFSFL